MPHTAVGFANLALLAPDKFEQVEEKLQRFVELLEWAIRHNMLLLL